MNLCHKFGRGQAAACAVLFTISLWMTRATSAQSVPVVTGDARVDKLLSQMTLAEKITLIHGTVEDPAVYQGQAGYLAGIKRLGIPSLRFADGPPGVLSRHPSQAETATMGVAATFSIQDAEDNGVVIGREYRAHGIDVALQPFINIDRDITFGRGYNTFGEDPFLTGVMGAAEIRGIQSQHVMAQAKHYIGYDSDSFNIYIDPQTLHEVNLAPFDEAVKAGVSSIMCSYNRLNGKFACDNSDTLQKILRDELGFKGFVTSDWGATHNVDFINHGLDMDMPGSLPKTSPMAGFTHSYFDDAQKTGGAPPKPDMAALEAMFFSHLPEEPAPQRNLGGFPTDSDPRNLRDALQDGTVSEATITRAAGRVLYEMDKFGYLDGKAKHEVTDEAIEANAKVIEKTAEDAAVLLKNDGALPLKSADLDSLAMIGPGAGQVMAIGTFGERSGGLPERQVGPVEALKKMASGAQVKFAVDDDMTGTPVPAGALSHDGQPGLERKDNSGKVQIDAELNFTKSNGKAFAPNTTYSWRGTLTVPSAGSYWLYLQMLGWRAKLKVDGKQVAASGGSIGAVHGDILYASMDNGIPTTDGLDNVRRALDLTAGPHDISVEVVGDTSNAPEQIRLNWVTPEQRQVNHEAAIAAAKGAKAAVVFLWTRSSPAFGLPGEQDKLVDEVSAVNPNTIVVLNTSQPIAMPWVDKVKAVLEMWWPGDEGGWATANLLLGKVSPAGRLPVTWARRLEDYAANDPAYPERSAKGVDHKTTFSEGVDVGYRWFDKKKIEPLFPFGFGLSYSKFEYSGLQLKRAADGGALVMFQVKNVGQVESDEVPQVYLGAPEKRPEGVQFAVRTLVGFERIHLKPGETKEVSLHLAPRRFQYWSMVDNKWVTAEVPRVVFAGGSSRDLSLQGSLE